MTAALRQPGLRYGGEGNPRTNRPDPVGHPRLPLDRTAPERQERTP
ncbi:hypothetical protein ACIRP7_21505 [Streptomyces sp. NPDC102270]